MNNIIVTIDKLSYSYGKKCVLSNVSMDIEKGSIVFLMGNNGSGKTTLIRCLMNHLHVREGIILCEGEDIAGMPRERLAKLISYVPQNINMNYGDLRVKDYLLLGRNPYIVLGTPQKEDYEVVDLYAKETGIENLLNTPFGSLSGGQKQWVAITRALVQQTPVIIMDEPMSALDLGKQADFLALLARIRTKEDKTIVLTSHNPNHCMMLDSTVCLLCEKQIFAWGKAEEVFNNQTIKKIYGNRVKMYEQGYIGFEKN